jgi:hypothetical protein
MSSRRQRWGHRAPSDIPSPTLADLEAELYQQTWEHTQHKTRSTFYVLAFDEEHARSVGAVRCAEQLLDLSAVALVENEAVDGGVEIRASILITESPEAFNARQREYARRQENANEAAAERDYEAFHSGSGPQTDAERYDAAAAFKRSLR